MNLFVISTPSQAFFLSKAPELIEEKSVLLITVGKKGYDVKIWEYLKLFPWLRVIILDVLGTESYASFYKIFLFQFRIQILKYKLPPVNKLYIGSFHNPFHLGIATHFEQTAKVYLLFDGLQMIEVARERKASILNYKRPFTKIFILAGFKSPNLYSITYISPLKLSIPSGDNLTLIQPLKYDLPQLEPNLIYFAGQPLVDFGIVSKRTYLLKLKMLKEKFPGATIEYVPHPKESSGILQEIGVIFKIHSFDKIFEEKYLESEFFAKAVVSFYSSVLTNLIYLKAETEIYAIKIYSNEILKEKKIDPITKIYTFFKEANHPNFSILKFK